MITLDEKISENINKEIDSQYQPYRDLNPDGDTKLTKDEFSGLAMNAFSAIDLDGDAELSQTEILKYNKYKRAKDEKERINEQKKLQKVNFRVSPKTDTEDDKVMQTMAIIKTINAAFSTFHDIYDALPGDMINAESRLPNCHKGSCNSGDGNSNIGDSDFKKIELFKDERHLFWIHLNKAKLLELNTSDSRISQWGVAFPSSPLGGGFLVYYHDGKKLLPNSFDENKAKSGHYILLTNDTLANPNYNNAHILTSYQARMIDRKLDDGDPLTGSVIAAGKLECLNTEEGHMTYKNNSEPCFSLYIQLR